MDTRFHAVYLLTSDDPQCEGMYYVGYTVDPLRRVQQHNGEKQNGAMRTSRKGQPWRMVCCVTGFSEDRAALKFEWMWQHAPKSKDIREETRSLLEKMKYKGVQNVFKGPGMHKQHLLSHARNGLCYAIGVLHILLRCELFRPVMLQLNVLEPAIFHREQGKLPQQVCPRLVPRPPLFLIRDPLSHEGLKALKDSCGKELMDYSGVGVDTNNNNNTSFSVMNISHISEIHHQNQSTATSVSIGGGGAPNANNNDNNSVCGTLSHVFSSQSIGYGGGGGASSLHNSMGGAVDRSVDRSVSSMSMSANQRHFGTLTTDEEREQLSREATLAHDRLLPCSLCGLSMPPYRYVRCTNRTRHCAPMSGDDDDQNGSSSATNRIPPPPAPQASSSGPSSPSSAVTPLDTILGGSAGRCPFRAHVACAALWFYYAKAHWPDEAGAGGDCGEASAGGVSGAAAHANDSADAPATAAATVNHLQPPELIPRNPILCPLCRREQVLHWSVLAQEAKRAMHVSRRLEEDKRRLAMEADVAAQRQRWIDAGLVADPNAKKKRGGGASKKTTRGEGAENSVDTNAVAGAAVAPPPSSKRSRAEQQAPRAPAVAVRTHQTNVAASVAAMNSSTCAAAAHMNDLFHNNPSTSHTFMDDLDALLGLSQPQQQPTTHGNVPPIPPPPAHKGGERGSTSCRDQQHPVAPSRGRGGGSRGGGGGGRGINSRGGGPMMDALAIVQQQAADAAMAWATGGGRGGLGAQQSQYDDDDDD